MIYVVVCIPILVGFAGLSVDVGRLQMAKTEAQSCADAAARFAAKGAATSFTPWATAYANALAIASTNTVDGGVPTINTTDVIQGNYNSSTKTFTTSATGNCIQVTVRQTLNRTGGCPLFMSIFTTKSMQVTAVAIAKCSSSATTIQPPASGNLWLSGVGDNVTTYNGRPDDSVVWDNSGTTSNPKQRPLEVDLAPLGLNPGDTIQLEGISGTASWSNQSSGTNNTADGDDTYLVANGVAPAGSVPTTSNNGLSNTIAPIGAVMGVFLTSASPTSTAAPANLDFSTQAARDYTTLSPVAKQVFFIGDGKTSDGSTQTIVIPAGATRLFLGMMDAWQWNDNVGNFTTTLYANAAVTLVK